jgi:hypothetical protein
MSPEQEKIRRRDARESIRISSTKVERKETKREAGREEKKGAAEFCNLEQSKWALSISF